jgi:hypothetical protein
MDIFLDNLDPELLEAKLSYIHMRWGIDKESLISFATMDGVLSRMSKNARKKFKRYLMSLEQAFECLSEEYPIEDRMKIDPFLKEYTEEVRRRLKDEAAFLRYLMGEWDDNILREVSIAQKKYMIPERAETAIQQNPRVTFQPYPEYRKYFNK